MKNLLLSILILSSLPTFAASQGAVAIENNRVVVYEAKSFKGQEHLPTFVFLPGIYRGYRDSDQIVKELNKKKVPYVVLHFAEQMDSVVKTDVLKTPDFKDLKTTDLVKEMEAVVQKLNLESVVPVTLSYSATITPFLDPKKYPVVVEASPIGQDTDTLPPSVVAFYEAWRAWLEKNPFGEMWLKAAKDFNLHQHWGVWINTQALGQPKLLNPIYRERAIQGYKALTLASEGFDLRNQNFAQGPERYFILGENEESARKEVQQEAIRKYQRQTGHKDNVIVVPKAGHVLMSDEPEAFVEALISIFEE